VPTVAVAFLVVILQGSAVVLAFVLAVPLAFVGVNSRRESVSCLAIFTPQLK
jgi:hypothetical protein